ncbi:hypothetical protein BLJAPNOD_04693 [Ensifer sp. M14]|nr:hypothetical protein BLJAPNOD_04693 [Ensifer sp. M14]
MENLSECAVRWSVEATNRIDTVIDMAKLTAMSGSADVFRLHTSTLIASIEEQLEYVRAECRFPVEFERQTDAARALLALSGKTARRLRIKRDQVLLTYRKVYIVVSERIERLRQQEITLS